MATMLQEMVDSHAARARTSVAEFEHELVFEIDFMVAEVMDYLARSVEYSGGVVAQSRENARAILDVESVFRTILDGSHYYPLGLKVVAGFADQVEEFRRFYEKSGRLPPMILDDDDVDVVANQGAAAIALVEGHAMGVVQDLRQLLARSLGENYIGDLVRGVSESIRKLSRVGPIIEDQVFQCFRIVGSLVYRRAEQLQGPLSYFYVGAGEPRRDFCRGLFGNASSMVEISSMNNGQIPGVLENAGGYGCKHWWFAGVSGAE